MGCDGGTIPRRDELVKQKQKPEQVDKEVEKVAKWRYCASSQEELVHPIVSCQLGKLYNKEVILNCLVSKAPIPNAPHIKSLKHIKELNLTPNPKYNKNLTSKLISTDTESGSGSTTSTDIKMSTKGVETNFTSQFMCPILGLDMNGAYKFCFLLKCGCVMSQKALKELKVTNCPKCNLAYTQDEVIIINGDECEVDALAVRMNERLSAGKCKSVVSTNITKISDANSTPLTSKRKLNSDCSHSLLVNGSKLVSPNTNILAAPQSQSIAIAAVKESVKKLKKEDIFGSVAYKSIFKPSTALSQ